MATIYFRIVVRAWISPSAGATKHPTNMNLSLRKAILKAYCLIRISIRDRDVTNRLEGQHL
jgi:hypothetical protein